MTDPKHTEPFVTQVDREAAAKCHEKSCYEIVRIQGSQCRNGYADGDYLVQAFARHRTAAEAASRQEVERLREALATAKNDLLTVGNDYPGSSCQKWCTERALAAWNVLEPWKHCPSTHCERSQECRAPNECSATRAALTASERGEA